MSLRLERAKKAEQSRTGRVPGALREGETRLDYFAEGTGPRAR